VVHLLVVAGVVVLVNLLPAFAPPTWAVLVYFRITDDLPIAATVAVGAFAAAAGRYGLALAFRRFGQRLPHKRRENLEALGTTLSSTRGLLGSLALFALSPLPSNTLFEAAGLARVRLGPLVAAFCAGRLVSYSIYLAAASRVAGSVRDVIAQGATSPQAIAVGLLGVASLVAVVLIDWIDVIDRTRAWLAHRRGRAAPPSIRAKLGPEVRR
jgi:membrane protein YqaA with SNARE-associated domain